MLQSTCLTNILYFCLNNYTIIMICMVHVRYTAVYPPARPAMPPGPPYTEEDFKQVKDMFPNLEDDIIQSVFAANNGNKDATINNLLQMSAD